MKKDDTVRYSGSSGFVQSERIKLNVGGRKFETTIETLTQVTLHTPASF